MLKEIEEEEALRSQSSRNRDSDDGLAENYDEGYDQKHFQSHIEMIKNRKRALEMSDEDSDNEETRNEGEDELPIPVYAMENKLRFCEEWNDDPELNGWLEEKANNTAFCRHCKCYLRIGSGKKDLLKHAKTAKHQRNINNISNFDDTTIIKMEEEPNESSKL